MVIDEGFCNSHTQVLIPSTYMTLWAYVDGLFFLHQPEFASKPMGILTHKAGNMQVKMRVKCTCQWIWNALRSISN